MLPRFHAAPILRHTRATFCVGSEDLTNVDSEEFVTPYSLPTQGSYVGSEVLRRMTLKNM
jgi:hypothetical protein